MRTIKTIIESIKPILTELVKLQRPTVAAAVVAFVVAIIPGVNASAALLVGILVGVGTGAAFLEKLIEANKTGQVAVRLPFKQ